MTSDLGHLKEGAVHSFLWQAVGFGGSRLGVFVTTLVLARLLAPEAFGIVAAGLVLVSILELGLDLGVGAALIYEQERGVSERVRAAFTLNLCACLLLTTAGVVFAPAVAALFDAAEHTAVFRAIFLFLLVRGAGQVHDAVLKRDMRFARRTGIEISRALVRAAVSIPLAFAGLGVWALVWGLLASEAAGTVLNWLAVRLRPALRMSWTVARPLLGFGIAVVTLKLVGWVYSNVDYLAVGTALGTTQLGLYSMAYRMPEFIIANVFIVFSTVAFPVYARARTEGQAALQDTLLRALMLTGLYGFTAATGLALVASDVVPLVLSEAWRPASTPMSLIALGMGLQAVGFAYGDVFPAVGRPGLMLRVSGPMALLLGGGIWVAASFGIVAVAWTQLLFHLVYAGVWIAVGSRVVGLGVRRQLAALWPGCCASLGIVMGAVPLQLTLQPSGGALALTVLAGVTGAIVALVIAAPSAIGKIRALLRVLVAAPARRLRSSRR